MGVIKDMLDAVKDISNTADDATSSFRKKSVTSISKLATEGTLQFPVLTSRSLDMQTCMLISKALEKNYASFVQISLTMNPHFYDTGTGGASDYLRQFHQNTDVKSNIFDVKNSLVAVSASESSLSGIYNDNIKNLKEYGSDLNMTVVNNWVKPEKEYNLNSRLVSESLLTKYGQPVTEALPFWGRASQQPPSGGSPQQSGSHVATTGQSPRSNPTRFDPDQEYFSAAVRTHPNDRDAQIQEYNRLRREGNVRTDVSTGTVTRIDIKGPPADYTLPRDILKWTDTQKMNELMPTHMMVKVRGVDKEGHPSGDMEFIIGIKATLHPIDSEEMVSNTVAACRNNNKIFNFIKWTTGEISFFKDFVFNMNEIKDDVTNRSSGASSWWITLKRRRVLSDIKKFTFLPNNILPNATLVLSMEEVNFIKVTYGFDLLSPYFMNNIMQTYFLLGFVVVDNSTQIAHFMFDGQQNFQTYTFAGLEKETKQTDEFKQMLKLINRI